MQMLCRRAMSQGTTNSISVPVDPEFWKYLTDNVFNVSFRNISKTIKVVKLDKGLKFYSLPVTYQFEQFTFDTVDSILQLRKLIGGAAVGYGVRKRRPRYDASPDETNLHLNDIINIVDCWRNGVGGPKIDDDEDLLVKAKKVHKRIELSFCAETCQLRVYVSYSAVTLNDDTLKSSRLALIGISSVSPVPPEKPLFSTQIDVGAEFVYPFHFEEDMDDYIEHDYYIYRVITVDDANGIVKAHRYCHVPVDGPRRKLPYSAPWIHVFHDPKIVLHAINHWCSS